MNSGEQKSNGEQAPDDSWGNESEREAGSWGTTRCVMLLLASLSVNEPVKSPRLASVSHCGEMQFQEDSHTKAQRHEVWISWHPPVIDGLHFVPLCLRVRHLRQSQNDKLASRGGIAARSRGPALVCWGGGRFTPRLTMRSVVPQWLRQHLPPYGLTGGIAEF